MQLRTLQSALGVLAITLSSSLLSAHGGIYRGPGDIVPPGGGGGPGRTGGGGGPTTGGPKLPGGPATGLPGGPGTGGPARPGGSPGGVTPGTTGIGGALPDDFTQWTYWWEFNKDAFIGLREAIHAGTTTTGLDDFYVGQRKEPLDNRLVPTKDQIQNDILPALKRAIDSTNQRDIVSSCMIGMAKIGQDHPEFELVDVFSPRLARDNQEIRETAALAMGIAAVRSEKALDTLVSLALDAPEGRRLVGSSVSVRTRSFALYGLGLYASEHAATEIKRRAFDAMRTVLESTERLNRNIQVAAVQGIGMLAFDPQNADSRDMLDDAISVLERFYNKKAGVSTQLIQAHCPTALTKLLGRNHARTEEFRKSFAAEIKGAKKGRRSNDLARSCVLALGQLCAPYDDKNSADAAYSKLLVETFKNHRDVQTRNFSLIALGQIGGSKNREYLLRTVRKGKKGSDRPWAAIGLGILCHDKHKADNQIDPDEMIGETLLKELDDARAPTYVGALGVALGLTRYKEAAPLMEKRIRDDIAKEEQAGYLCLGLALMKERRSIETIRETMGLAKRRPTLFAQAATALGVLGDKSAAEELHHRLHDEARNLSTLSAIASALGKIGDRRSVKPLKDALFDTERGELQRAFAAVALGGVADRALMPWHTKISKNINYRAAVATLTDSSSGILDIL